jgi:hypothetical protein
MCHVRRLPCVACASDFLGLRSRFFDGRGTRGGRRGDLWSVICWLGCDLPESPSTADLLELELVRVVTGCAFRSRPPTSLAHPGPGQPASGSGCRRRHPPRKITSTINTYLSTGEVASSSSISLSRSQRISEPRELLSSFAWANSDRVGKAGSTTGDSRSVMSDARAGWGSCSGDLGMGSSAVNGEPHIPQYRCGLAFWCPHSAHKTVSGITRASVATLVDASFEGTPFKFMGSAADPRRTQPPALAIAPGRLALAFRVDW